MGMSWAWLLAGAGALALLGILTWRWRVALRSVQAERVARESHAERIRELERLAARNRAILQSAMDGFFVLGEDYRFLEVNTAFSRMTGYSAEELLQMKMTH